MERATRRPVGQPEGPGTGETSSGPSRRRPWALVAVCGLVLLQAGVLVGLAGAWVVELVEGSSGLPAASIFLALFALGVAAVLLLATRGLWAGRRWARSPIMTWQVLLVVMAIGWLGADPAPWVVAVLASAVVVAGALLLPPVVTATVDADRR